VDDEQVAKMIAMICPTEVRELTAEGESYEAARDAVREQVPEGWQVISYRTVKD
jgi:hypothetical protein